MQNCMRKIVSKTLKNTLTASLVIFLISCGGGGNDSPPVSVAPTPIPPTPPVSSVLKLNSDQ